MAEAEYWPDGAFCRLTVGHHWEAVPRADVLMRAFGAKEKCSRCGTIRQSSMPRNSEGTIKFRRPPVISLRRYDQVPLSPEAVKCSPEPIRKELERKTMEHVREATARLLAMGCVNIRVEPLPPPSVGFKLVGDKPVEVDGEAAPEAESNYSKVPLQTCENCGFEARILYGSQWKCGCGSVNPVE